MRTFYILFFFSALFFSSENVKAQCQSAFTINNNGNGDYDFINTSNGGVDYLWSFGDGTSATDSNAIHQFVNGTYSVCLTIQDSTIGCSSTFCSTLFVDSATVPNPCTLSAYYTYTIDSNAVYTFTPNVTGGTFPYSYSWDFSASGGDMGSVVTHDFVYNGTYGVYFAVTDAQGCSSFFGDSVVVTTALVSCDIVADFIFTDDGGGAYSFTSTSTGNIANHSWNIGGSYSMLLTPSYSFPMDGIYTVVLYVSDSANFCTDYYTESIAVSGVLNPVECNASFSIYTDSTYNGVYVVNSSAGNNLSYFWDFGDGNTSTLPYPNYTYGTGGPFELCLTVTSDSGCTSSYCDSISSGGIVNKQDGFDMSVIAPITTNINTTKSIGALNVYPNPFEDKVNVIIDLIEPSKVSIQVTDLLGNVIETLVDKQLTGKNKLSWNAEDQPNGIYLLNLKTNQSVQIEKLVLNR